VTQELRGPGMEDRVAALEATVAARTRDLRAALEQKSALLHELDHRVKNNLQLISSLMLMQARRARDPEVRAALSAMQRRLAVVGVVHRRLFQSEDVRRFDLSAFVYDLVGELRGGPRAPPVELACRLKPVDMAATRAVPLALLINELLTHALDHGFPAGRAGRMHVGIVKVDGDLRIEIEDDGVGGSADAGQADESTAPGFGLMIVDLLGRQLKAQILREDTAPGRRVRVSLPAEADGNRA